jgi:hypothetical protein
MTSRKARKLRRAKERQLRESKMTMNTVRGAVPASHPRLYWAYGSNLNILQMQARCKDSFPVSPYTMPNCELMFDGVASVRAAEGKECPGALWAVSLADIAALDRYEGFPTLYQKVIFRVDEEQLGFYYVMGSAEDSAPSLGYMATCMEGTMEWDLPLQPMIDAWIRAERTDEDWTAEHGVVKYGRGSWTTLPNDPWPNAKDQFDYLPYGELDDYTQEELDHINAWDGYDNHQLARDAVAMGGWDVADPTAAWESQFGGVDWGSEAFPIGANPKGFDWNDWIHGGMDYNGVPDYDPTMSSHGQRNLLEGAQW